MTYPLLRKSHLVCLSFLSLAAPGRSAEPPEPGLLFALSGDHGTTADYAANGQSEPNFSFQVEPVADGAKGPGLRCGNLQRLAYWAPGNIYAQRGTLSFFWRARDPVGPTEFPVFRVGYADHSSWDMVFLRIDYNGHGFDAFVTDASLARTRISVTVDPFPSPETWIHLALSWDETRGIRFYVNGKLAARNETTAVYNAALDQFGPHSRIISPYNVQSDYNFVRGGDIDEVRIYDHMLGDSNIGQLAKTEALAKDPLPPRTLAESRWRDEWWLRYGWNRPDDPPPYLADPAVRIRKVEIHDAYDLKRWWWKACDGIRETTWPGVFNRSRLPGRSDYFHLPDWDCYSLSGKSITFNLPEEPWNHLEISGAAWGTLSLLGPDTGSPATSKILFERPMGQEKTVHTLAQPAVGQRIRFDNIEQEEPIGELAAYYVSAGREPAGSSKLAYRLAAVPADNPTLASLVSYIRGRHTADERATVVAQPKDGPSSANKGSALSASIPPITTPSLPLVHILVPCEGGGDAYKLSSVEGGLDGIAFDLPALKVKPTHGEFIALNIQVKDPLWPLRNMLDFNFSVKPGEARTLWLDLRDRLLPPGKSLYLTIAAAGADFGPASLAGAELRLVFKPREAARAEHEIDRFTQAKDSYAMLVEEHPTGPIYNLWNRFEADLTDLLRVNPEHNPGRSYLAIAKPGSPRPPFVQPEPPAGVPLWAFRQVEALRRVKNFVTWWIDHRQIENGEFGGGLSDDTDLTNVWPGVALMGCEPDKLLQSIRSELDAIYRQHMFTNGLPTIQTDELHSYEEGINCLGQALILDYGSPKQIERAMENARGIESITGINSAGHRHIRTSYFSGTRVAEDDPWGYAKAYSYLVLQPAQLIVDYNGNPRAKKYLLELADGLLAHRRKNDTGTYELPSAVHFKDDKDATSTRANFPWPLFWTAWKWTGEKKYLSPIFDGGTTALMQVNANTLDLLGIRADWGPRFLKGEPGTLADPGAHDARGAQRRSSDYRAGRLTHIKWQLVGDKHLLEKLYAEQIETMALGEYINTEGSLWIDRVGVPYSELQRARLGGIALERGATNPGHTVSWKFQAPATDQSLAILIPNAKADQFTVVAYNLETKTVQASLTGWNIDPGQWEITQGLDTDDDDKADRDVTTRTVLFERTRSLELTFPPRTTTVLTFKLKTPGTPYWERSDLGVEREDIQIHGRELRVTVHSLGSVRSLPTQLVFRDRTGRIVSIEAVPELAAPTDLMPKSVDINMTLPDGLSTEGGTVEIDPEHRNEEITTMNNRVRL